MKQIILCADDYSQTPSISKGILTLLQEKRLSATTCMTNSPDWITQAQWLQAVAEHSDIGLHLNFTEGSPLTPASTLAANGQFNSLPKLLILAHLGALNRSAIATELNAQLDQFLAAMGKLPDFIDGHQHIHHLPLIAEVLLETYQKRLRTQGSYLRSVTCRRSLGSLLGESSALKKLALELTGARRFQKQLIRQAIPHTTSFSGVYQFTDKIAYRKLFLGFLQQIEHRGLIMCHPGLADTEADSSSAPDPIAKNRAIEFQYFASKDFIKDCQDNQVEITRF